VLVQGGFSMSPKRTLQVFNADLLIRKKNLSLSLIGFIVFYIILGRYAPNFFYELLLYSVGFVITSLAFIDLHAPERAYFFLTLPASSFEKFFVRWLMTGIFFVVSSLVICFICSGLMNALFSPNLPNIDLSDQSLWITIQHYLLLQPVILLGAISFKKNILLKTMLCFISLLLMITITVFLASYFFCPNCLLQGLFQIIAGSFQGEYFYFWIVFSPLCLVLAFIKFKKLEI